MLTQRTEQINYARLEGIDRKELPATVVFTTVYIPLLCLCIFYSMRSTYVYKSLTVFCLGKPPRIWRSFHATHDSDHPVRVVAFVIRAVLSVSATAGNDINLVVAQMVIFNIGFSGLLYSAYGLVLDRYVHHTSVCSKFRPPLRLRYSILNSSEGKGVAGRFSMVKNLLRNRMLFRAAVTAAIVMGIVGGVRSRCYVFVLILQKLTNAIDRSIKYRRPSQGQPRKHAAKNQLVHLPRRCLPVGHNHNRSGIDREKL